MSKLFAAVLFAGALCAGEFWNDKDPAQWSEKEVERLLTKSPWAKQVTPAMDFSGMGDGPPGGGGMGAPPGGGGMGGPPGGGMGGPPGGGGMGGPPGGGMPEMKATVRWESAEPIRTALKRSAPDDHGDLVIVSVTGLPMMGRGGNGNEQMAARRNQMREAMKEKTTLTGKGKTSLRPSRVHVEESTGTMYFFFPKDESISADAKEFVFTTQLGPMELKAKFSPKEMRYKGQSAL